MKQKKLGFTIIELSLSIAFVAVLLIGIASIVIHMTSIFRKGLSLKAINATGQQIIEDMQRTMGSSSYTEWASIEAMDTNSDGTVDSTEFTNSTRNYYFEAVKDGKQQVGVLCIGNYAYIWNTAYILNKNDAGIYIRSGSSGDYVKRRLARISDITHKQCKTSEDDSIAKLYSGHTDDYKLQIEGDNVVDLIQKDEVDLAIYDFKITPAVRGGGVTTQAFMSASFVLATLRGGINISSNGDYCSGDAAAAGAGEYNNSDFDYCAVNKFNFTMRTGGNASRL